MNQVGFEQRLRETRYESGLTLGQLAEIIKEVLQKEEVEALVKLLTYENN